MDLQQSKRIPEFKCVVGLHQGSDMTKVTC
jgi:hypothetical protein